MSSDSSSGPEKAWWSGARRGGASTVRFRTPTDSCDTRTYLTRTFRDWLLNGYMRWRRNYIIITLIKGNRNNAEEDNPAVWLFIYDQPSKRKKYRPTQTTGCKYILTVAVHALRSLPNQSFLITNIHLLICVREKFNFANPSSTLVGATSQIEILERASGSMC